MESTGNPNKNESNRDSIVARGLPGSYLALGCLPWARRSYLSTICYPSTAVQPFVRTQLQGGNEVFLVMEEIDSHHQEDPVASEEYSTDGRSNWQKIPAGIRVLGSKYALVLDKIEQVDLQFDLAKSRVAVGRKVGRAGSAYIKGRVDKACLEVTEMPVDPEQSIIKRITTPTGRGYCRGTPLSGSVHGRALCAVLCSACRWSGDARFTSL